MGLGYLTRQSPSAPRCCRCSKCRSGHHTWEPYHTWQGSIWVRRWPFPSPPTSDLLFKQFKSQITPFWHLQLLPLSTSGSQLPFPASWLGLGMPVSVGPLCSRSGFRSLSPNWRLPRWGPSYQLPSSCPTAPARQATWLQHEEGDTHSQRLQPGAQGPP